MSDPRDLRGAVVAVIGASGGLGSELTRALATRGARLLVCGRHPERLARTAPAGATVVELDLRDTGAGDRIAAAALGTAGRLDGVVNAAGIVAFGTLAETDDVVLEELFLTNVLGPLWTVRRLIPLLAETKGFVVNVSAVVAEQPLPGMAGYAASKAALTAADRALARELRRLGITVCDARPPHTETGLATRPLAGEPPRLPTGLEPAAVAERIVVAIEEGADQVAAAEFGEPSPAATAQ